MTGDTGHLSIWYCIGLLLLVYGVLIFGAGVYELIVPPERVVVLAELHAGIWWGALLAVMGGIYAHRFRPKKGGH